MVRKGFKKRLGWGMIGVFGVSVLMTGCSKIGGGYQKYSVMNFTAFDTVSEIKAYSMEDQTENLEILNHVLDEWDALFDIYETQEGVNNLKTVNDMAGKEPVVVDERILDVLAMGVEMEEMTQGRCNIAFGSVLSVWHEYREKGQENPENAKVPPKELLEEAAEHTDISDLVIDRKKGTVYLKDPKMSLDVGAIAKGCAADAVAEKARELGMDSVMISLGGNILTVGSKKENGKESDWIAGIQNPDLESEASYLYKLPLKDMALVTSGDYQRFYEADGRRYSHIIDPDTLFPPEYYRSVTVYAEKSGMADALSTALFLADIETGKEMLLKAGKNCEAVWILQDGSVEMTEGMEKIIQK